MLVGEIPKPFKFISKKVSNSSIKKRDSSIKLEIELLEEDDEEKQMVSNNIFNYSKKKESDFTQKHKYKAIHQRNPSIKKNSSHFKNRHNPKFISQDDIIENENFETVKNFLYYFPHNNISSIIIKLDGINRRKKIERFNYKKSIKLSEYADFIINN